MAPLDEIHNGVRPQKSYLKERSDRRPGPKPKPLNERPYKPPKPIKRTTRTYTRERKIEVIQFREHHRIQMVNPETGLVSYRPPTFKEMSAFWKIPDETIRGWWHSKETIIQSQSGSRSASRPWLCTWPDMEKKLYTKFIQKRAANSLVRRSWFRHRSKQI